MLLFDDSKKLEKALGEEAAAVIAHVFEQANERWRHELATRADIQSQKTVVKLKTVLRHELATKADIQNLRDVLGHMATKVELTQTKHDILRWVLGGFIAQTALIVAIMAFLRP